MACSTIRACKGDPVAKWMQPHTKTMITAGTTLSSTKGHGQEDHNQQHQAPPGEPASASSPPVCRPAELPSVMPTPKTTKTLVTAGRREVRHLLQDGRDVGKDAEQRNGREGAHRQHQLHLGAQHGVELMLEVQSSPPAGEAPGEADRDRRSRQWEPAPKRRIAIQTPGLGRYRQEPQAHSPASGR